MTWKKKQSDKRWKTSLIKLVFSKIYKSNYHNSRSYRRSHRMCSIQKGVFKNFAKSTRKHLCQSLYFNKVAGLRTATLLKERFWRRCFPVNFTKEHLLYATPPGECF